MTAPAPADDRPQSLQSARLRSRRRVWLLGGAAVLILVGAGAAWWSLRPTVVDPPMPAGIQDREVQEVIESARAAVLEQPHSADAWGYLGKVFLSHLFDREATFCFNQASQ